MHLARVGTLLTLVSLSAVAAPRDLVFSYVREAGAEGCPDERWLRQAVSARLGADPFRDDADLHIDAKINHSGRALIGQLRVDDRRHARVSRRELSSPVGDCLELASAMELAIAIAVDPHYLARPAVAPERPPPPPLAPLPVAPPPTEPEVKRVEPLAPSPPATVNPAFQGGLGVLASAGLSPFATPGLAINAKLQWPRLSVGVEARADLQSSVNFRDGRVGSTTLLGSLVPCVSLGPLSTCALVSAGALQITGEIVPPARRESSPLFLAGVRAEYSVSLADPWALRAFADVQAVLTRTTVLSGVDPVWVTAPVTASLGVAVDLHFLQ